MAYEFIEFCKKGDDVLITISTGGVVRMPAEKLRCIATGEAFTEPTIDNYRLVYESGDLGGQPI